MKNPRLFVAKRIRPDEPLSLDRDSAHYVSRVLRARVGDTVTLFDGSGAEYPARIAALGRHEVQLVPGAAVDVARESPLDLHLAQGLSRGDRMDTVVQKATELGVRRILPFATEFSVVRLDAERAAKKQRHWQAVAHSACEQCGRNRPPVVAAPSEFSDLLATEARNDTLCLLLQPGATESLRELPRPSGRVLVLVGPEGGFSPTEQQQALAAGCIPVSFGPRVLRTETAALAALAVMQALWGDLAPVRG